MKRIRITATIMFVTTLLMVGCIKVSNEYSVIPPGSWRATLDLATESGIAGAFDEKTKGQLPFNFNVIYDSQDSFHLEILNGEERIQVTKISYGHDITTGRDTIWIDFPVYGSYITASYEEDAIEGYWCVASRDDYCIRFRARHSKNYRFDTHATPPTIDVNGRWKVEFSTGTDDAYPALAYLEQVGDKLTGTFLTETGDYRYLEGNVAGDRMYLSVFDGEHVFLFEAKMLEDGTLSGSFRSGKHYKTYWVAERSDTFELQDPYSLTYLNPGYETFDFSFESIDGNIVSSSDPLLQGRPKLIQIFGTWCPNCRDETNFLVNYLSEHPDIDLTILGLGFERYKDKDKALQALRNYQNLLKIPYDILYAGPSDKGKASEILPALNRVISYPTLIFIDRQNRVRKIHTGFTGPATPQYEPFKTEFHAAITELLESD